MKWYTWVNWLGVFFFCTFGLAMWLDDPWILLGFLLGAIAITVESVVQRRISDGSAAVTPKPKKQPEPTWEELYSRLDDVPEPPFPLMPTPAPVVPPTEVTGWHFSIDVDLDYTHEDIFADRDVPKNVGLKEAVALLKNDFFTVNSMLSDFDAFWDMDLYISRDLANGKSDTVWVNNNFEPVGGWEKWEKNDSTAAT